MGVSSNSKVFLSDKDLKGTTTNNNNNNNIMDQEVGLLVIPTMEKIHKECETLTQEDHHQLIRLKQLSVQEQEVDDKDHHHHHHHRHQEEQKQHNNFIVTNVSVSPLNLKIEIPSNVRSDQNDVDDCSNEGFKTPTSSDHKIPMILECPGAPKKTKPKPDTKRKACRRRIMLDLSTDLESLFPMPYVVNKRVKQCSGNDSKTCHKGMR